MNQNFSHDQVLSQQQQVHLSDYFNIIRKRKWVIIVFSLVVVCIATYKTVKTTPVYKATTQIIIEGPTSFMDEMADVMYTGSMDQAYYETQHNLLTSRSLASNVIKDLRLREYLANRPQKKPGILTLAKNRVSNFIGSFFSQSGRNASETQTNTFIEQGKGKGSEYVTKKRDWQVSWYLSNLAITPIPKTHLVDIGSFGESPEMVARIANAHAHAFIEKNIQIQRLASQQALNWLETQLRGQKAKVESSRRTVSEYTYKQLNSLSIDDERLFSLPEIKQNSAIKGLRSHLIKLNTQKLEMATKYGHKYPRMVELTTSIKQVEQEIIDEVNRIKMSIKAELDNNASLENSMGQATKDLQQGVDVTNGEKLINYDILQLESESDQAIYDILLKQAKEINLTGNLERLNIRIVDEAEVPRSPFKPKIFINILLSMVMGLTFGTGLAFFLEYMNKTITTPEDIARHMGMAVLGLLPYDRSLKRNDILALPSSESNHKKKKRKGYYGRYDISGSLVASLPLIQTNLQMSGQVFMIESSRAGEGKTTVLSKTAISLARGGLRVVMVDADTQRPNLHNMFGLKNGSSGGLLNAMTGIMSQEIRHGTLEKCSIYDLFSIIALKKQSGQLTVTNDTQTMTAVFKDGRLYHLQSQDIPFDNRLGTMLLRGGFITESQLKDALERSKRTGQPLGYILVNAGYVNQDKLQGPLKLQMEEHLHKLFIWKEGTFVFESGRIATYEDKRIHFQEDYAPIINRLGSMAGSRLLESEVLSNVKSLDEPNLSILSCGIGPLGSDSVLFVALLAKFFDLLKNRFDIVLVDAPPVLETMGSVKHLISLVDGVIYVIKSGHISIKDVKEATYYLKEGKTKIIGTILNQVKVGRGYYNDY